MRWQELFADLEGQAQAWERTDLEAEISDRSRAETAQVLLINRLRHRLGASVRLTVLGVGRVEGTLEQVGADWVLLHGSTEEVVSMSAVLAAPDLGPASVSPGGVGVVAQRLGLTSALRAIAIDRCPVRACLRDGSTVVGTPHRVGADFVDIAVHDVGELARRDVVRGTIAVAFSAIATVRRLSSGWDV
ncbi:MAG: hypothetical protein H0U61_06640, partial [Nocardioidaceae bacterium]|nr:hypothetical protein [Nocardioidaceae bacterium]